MNDNFLDSLQYDEDAPDVKAIMAQVRGYLVATKPGVQPEVHARVAGARLAPEVYEELERMRTELGTLHVTVYVTPVRVPIIGPLSQRVRRLFHQLVVYYVDKVADAQTRINTRLVRVLTAVVAQVDQGEETERVRGLEARIEELESRVKSLEASLRQSGTAENS